MSIARTLSVVVLAAVSTFAVGCSSSAEEGNASGSNVTLTGNIGSGSSAVKTFGGVSATGGGLHVVARKLHHNGEKGGVIDVPVASDGSFRLGMTPGARYVVTIDDAAKKSAMLAFGAGKNVIAVPAAAGGQVDLGGVKISGGEAYTDLAIDGKLGLATTLAELDEVFEAADGAIASAREAIEQALKAADDARDAAADALEQARKAREEAEKAAKAAGG